MAPGILYFLGEGVVGLRWCGSSPAGAFVGRSRYFFVPRAEHFFLRFFVCGKTRSSRGRQVLVYPSSVMVSPERGRKNLLQGPSGKKNLLGSSCS